MYAYKICKDETVTGNDEKENREQESALRNANHNC